MSDPTAEYDLDARLRQVPLPPRLLGRIRGIAALSDEELDFRLREVSVPAGLTDRLRDGLLDAWIDERVRRVELPARLLPRSRVIPFCRPRSRSGRLALAALLLVSVTAAYLAGLGSIVGAIRPLPRPPVDLLVVDTGPLGLQTSADDPVELAEAIAVDRSSPVQDGLGHQLELFPLLDRLAPGPAGELAAELRDRWNPWENWVLLRWGVLGYGTGSPRPLPAITCVAAPRSGGLAASLARGHDRGFLFARSVHPPAFVGLNDALRACHPPLARCTDSFDAACFAARQRLPLERESIRVEDFLAAMRFGFDPPRPRQLAVRAAAGPSVFNAGGASLLQIGVVAGDSAAGPPPASHLVVALDVSEPMAWDHRLARASLALQRFLDEAGPETNLSLVVFSRDAALLVREASPQHFPPVAGLLEELTPSGAANLPQGIAQAAGAVIEAEAASRLPAKLVVISPSGLEADEGSRDGLRPILEAAQRAGLAAVDVLDLGGEIESASWQRLLEPIRCTVRPARDPGDMLRQLQEICAGDSTRVASEVRLTVRFNPRAVVAWRLLGHEATAYGGLLSGSELADLHAGEEATALFEVWLAQRPADTVATVELTWTDPDSGQARRVPSLRIGHRQFAASFEEFPASLQVASLAAETAERLGRGYGFAVTGPAGYQYQPKPRELGDLQGWLERASADVRARPSFQRLAELIAGGQASVRVRSPQDARAGRREFRDGGWREL